MSREGFPRFLCFCAALMLAVPLAIAKTSAPAARPADNVAAPPRAANVDGQSNRMVDAANDGASTK